MLLLTTSLYSLRLGCALYLLFSLIDLFPPLYSKPTSLLPWFSFHSTEIISFPLWPTKLEATPRREGLF